MKLPVPALAMTTSSDVTESLASRVLTAWAIEASSVRIMRSERSYIGSQIGHAGMQMMILIH